MPRLKGVSFETAVIERYRRRESSVEEALIEMYPAGVSVRRVEDITEALRGSKVSPATISELNKKAYVHIEDWRTGLCRADGIRMSAWTASACAATEAENTKMSPFRRQLP